MSSTAVMRDVDLAVSVAHAGGVTRPGDQPSTVEMRRAIVGVQPAAAVRQERNAVGKPRLIKGTRGITVQLGSGVWCAGGGTMLNILPCTASPGQAVPALCGRGPQDGGGSCPDRAVS